MNPVLRICKVCRFYLYKPKIAPWHICKVKELEYPKGTVGLGHLHTFGEDVPRTFGEDVPRIKPTGVMFGKQDKRKEPPYDYFFTGEDFGIPLRCPYYLEQLMANQEFEVKHEH